MSYARRAQIYEDDGGMTQRYEENKLPSFLQKLWDIVEDPSYYDIVRWDEVFLFL